MGITHPKREAIPRSGHPPNLCTHALPLAAEWDALAVLLARGDFGIADRWALLRTCKTFSRLVLSSARAIHVTLDEAGRFHSPYTAQLLSDIIGSTRTEAASEAGGPEVQLTLRTTPSHSLPKASITTLILQDVVLMLSELNDYLVQLSEHTRLKTLRIQGLTWAPDFGGGASSTEHDALQITAESLKIEDSPTALPWGSASCALKGQPCGFRPHGLQATCAHNRRANSLSCCRLRAVFVPYSHLYELFAGALVNCTSLAVPVWISLCFLQEQVRSDSHTGCHRCLAISLLAISRLHLVFGAVP